MNIFQKKLIPQYIGVFSLLCYAVTALSYFLTGKKLLLAFEFIYFLGICGTVFYLVYLVVIQSKKKEFRENTHLAFSALIFLGILIFIFLIAQKHQKIIDVTHDKRYSLSDQTKSVLASVDTPVDLIVFARQNQPGKDMIETMLKQYALYSDYVSYEFVNPQEQPTLAEEYAIDRFGQIVIRTGDEYEKVDRPDEETVTNTIAKLFADEKKKVWFLSGHAEMSLNDTEATGYSLVKRFLDAENYTVEEKVLLRESEIPQDVNVLVIASPKTDLFESELTVIKAYYNAGGSVCVLVDPEPVETVQELLRELNIEVKPGILVDTMSKVFGASPLIPVISQYVPHAITDKFRVASFLPTACSVDVVAELPEGVSGHTLAYTGPGSWVETDMESIKTKVTFDKETDVPGPISVMAVVEKTVSDTSADDDSGENKTARLVVVGDSNFIDNSNISLSGNKDLFLNTMAWLARDENLISIRKTETESVPMFLSVPQQIVIFVVPVVVLPLLALSIGIIVMIRIKNA